MLNCMTWDHQKWRALAPQKKQRHAMPPPWRLVYALLLVVLLQWCLLSYVLYSHHNHEESTPNILDMSKQKRGAPHQVLAAPPSNKQQQQQQEWTGVAVTLALRAPKWFHRRYTYMLENILLNTPDTWAVQVFYRHEWWTSEVLKLHRGMPRITKNQRVILTPLPEQFWNMKPKDVMMDEWIWQEMVADRVLLFSGNGVLCAHSIATVQDFEGLDYVGVPWGQGEGGDGSTHSLRNRTAVLEAIPHYGNKGRPEHSVLLETMQKLNKETPGRFHLASVNDTFKFGGAELIMDSTVRKLHNNYEQYGPPLVLSGTQSQLPWEIRDALLGICPEWKIIFPSLHEPNCFGASLNPEKCAATICALQPNKTSC